MTGGNKRKTKNNVIRRSQLQYPYEREQQCNSQPHQEQNHDNATTVNHTKNETMMMQQQE